MVSDFISKQNYFLSSTGSEKGKREQFLRFHLEPDTKVMLSVPQLTEILKIPVSQIIPIPHMPDWVMGVYNWRGEILWMVDLGYLVGLTPWHAKGSNSSNYTVAVISSIAKNSETKETGKKTLGLIVAHVEDIELCNPDLIKSPPASAVTRELAPFLRGCWITPDGEMFLILDGDSIIAAMPQSM